MIVLVAAFPEHQFLFFQAVPDLHRAASLCHGLCPRHHVLLLFRPKWLILQQIFGHCEFVVGSLFFALLRVLHLSLPHLQIVRNLMDLFLCIFSLLEFIRCCRVCICFTIVSTFSAHGRTFALHQPTPESFLACLLCANSPLLDVELSLTWVCSLARHIFRTLEPLCFSSLESVQVKVRVQHKVRDRAKVKFEVKIHVMATVRVTVVVITTVKVAAEGNSFGARWMSRSKPRTRWWWR